ncbi:MAG: hypothetical protein PHQ96_09830, partial [Candidatus Omnitrophica bacterium]|nr:hypothetical protein [Candidatus Omnitrophota bacterium]
MHKYLNVASLFAFIREQAALMEGMMVFDSLNMMISTKSSTINWSKALIKIIRKKVSTKGRQVKKIFNIPTELGLLNAPSVKSARKPKNKINASSTRKKKPMASE